MKTLINSPLARDTDPMTSHEAAEKMVKSGALQKQEQEVYEAIQGWHSGGFTTKDIAIKMIAYTIDKAYDICRKRFSGLQNKGKIEVVKEKQKVTNCTFVYKDKRRDGCRVWRLK